MFAARPARSWRRFRRRSIGQQLNNPNDYRWSMRALLLCDESLDQGRHGAAAEPVSEDRRQHAGAARFAEVPHARRRRHDDEAHKAYRVFYGPDFASKGIITQDPPEVNRRSRSSCRRWMPTATSWPA